MVDRILKLLHLSLTRAMMRNGHPKILFLVLVIFICVTMVLKSINLLGYYWDHSLNALSGCSNIITWFIEMYNWTPTLWLWFQQDILPGSFSFVDLLAVEIWNYQQNVFKIWSLKIKTILRPLWTMLLFFYLNMVRLLQVYFNRVLASCILTFVDFLC